MSRLPVWLNGLGDALQRMGARLDARRAEAERDDPLAPPYRPTDANPGANPEAGNGSRTSPQPPPAVDAG
ncbi:MAG TPA: AI-2E family transporter, partial [Streptomyces sp.]